MSQDRCPETVYGHHLVRRGERKCQACGVVLAQTPEPVGKPWTPGWLQDLQQRMRGRKPDPEQDPLEDDKPSFDPDDYYGS